ncbi:MAG: Serine/threonine protein kinase PrkC, regulator of stationary phase [Myxococcaceae bacterium]|nr:Serine/threonine protein kinase PrkC, regulator of stationary phase [Myxococcaceae bacterium]
MDADPLGSADQLVGRTIGGKFAIEEHLGCGAMGAVYRARQIALDKVVAIKVLHRRLASDARFIDSFQREAYAASRLDHPNSMRVLDFGKEPDGLLYIAMELVAGRNLLELLDEEWPLPQARIVDIVSQILAALAVAHEMGVLHRDLKPENVMLVQGRSDDGQRVDVIKVCDFGIAKIGWNHDVEDASTPAMLRRAKLSMSVVVGTPSYMSPEQARGEPVDASTDLYSIGVLLYQLITGRLPFEGSSTMAVLLRHAHEPPKPPHLLVPLVNRKLEAICLKALQKSPKDRYGSAREMRAALRDVAHAFSAASLADTLTEPVLLDRRTRATLWRRGPHGRVATRLGILALAAVLGVFGWRLARPPRLAMSTASSPLDVAAAEPQPPRGGVVLMSASATRSVSTSSEPASPSALAVRPVKSQSTFVAPTKPSASARAEIDPPVAAPLPAAVIAAAPIVASAPPPPVRSPPPARPPAPPRPSPDAAWVSVGSPPSPRGTTPANVTKVVVPLSSRMTDCYRGALRQVVSSAGADGGGVLHIETDDDGVIVEAHYRGPLAPALAGCVAAVVRGRKLPNVDTGSVSADIPLTFHLR